MRGFDHATILSPSFHGLRKERVAQWPPHLYIKYDENPPGGVLQEKLGGGVRHAFWNLRPKSVIFRTLFQTWSLGALRVTGTQDKLLRHVQGWRKH